MARRLTRREHGIAAVVVAAVDSDAPAVKDLKSANISSHLSVSGRVNLGSFYTPARYVERVAGWLRNLGANRDWCVADLSCGYGAFFELADCRELAACRYIGNDIDTVAVARAREMFPGVRFYTKNALVDVKRGKFGIEKRRRLVIVGNPPYNDVTSQINQGVKDANLPVDEDIRTRDLGMSSLLAYNKLRADYVAVLHPLSYLIKKANFNATKRFFSNYELVNHVIFSSQEFAGTSRLAGFPVIVALYRRTQTGRGLTHEAVKDFRFRTIEGDEFSLNGFDYVTDYIEKYPHKKRYRPEILFYTMRDINALKRSRTFIGERIPNAVDVDPEKLPYYCYVDCFKRYANVPYWMGNFNVPFISEDFDEIRDLVVADARFHNQEVFGRVRNARRGAELAIRNYIDRVIRH